MPLYGGPAQERRGKRTRCPVETFIRESASHSGKAAKCVAPIIIESYSKNSGAPRRLPMRYSSLSLRNLSRGRAIGILRRMPGAARGRGAGVVLDNPNCGATIWSGHRENDSSHRILRGAFLWSNTVPRRSRMRSSRSLPFLARPAAGFRSM